jgi:hypothetical protein
MPPDHRTSMTNSILFVFSIVNPVPDYRKYLQIQDSVHRLCGMEEDVLGPMLGDLVQIQCEQALLYLSFPSLSQHPLDQRSTNAGCPTINPCHHWTICP